MKPRVFVSRDIPREWLAPLPDEADIDMWDSDLPPPRDELLRRVSGVDGYLSMTVDRIDDELLDHAGPRLRVVANFGVGFDNVDVPACTRRGVAVGNTAGVLSQTTADLAFALLMAAARRLAEGYEYVRQGRWDAWKPLLLLGPDIHGATLGIIGLGRIGREVARRARGFDMTVLYHNRHPLSVDEEEQLKVRRADLDELLSASDFVSVHVALTPATRQMINRETLTKMKRSSILINTARGAVVHSDDLYEALRSGVIAGAALDVTDPEPLPRDHKLLTLPNCLVAPHIASATVPTRQKMASISAANIVAGLERKPLPSFVNPDAYQVQV